MATGVEKSALRPIGRVVVPGGVAVDRRRAIGRVGRWVRFRVCPGRSGARMHGGRTTSTNPEGFNAQRITCLALHS